jgi:hypothetical protein
MVVKRRFREAETTEQRLQRWLRHHYTPDRINEAQALPLRRDMVTFLTYVRDHTVTGTKSTGNMPLKHIRQVTAQFVDPPVLDTEIGGCVFKLRSEDEVWSLLFLHILASVSGLVLSLPGRKWRLASDVPAFLDIDPLFQLAFLLWVWWYNVDWLVAYPFEGMGEWLPESLEMTTLTQLRLIRTATEIPFDEFADELIDKTGMTWTAPDTTHAREFLHTRIRRMVIDILEDFGAVTCTYHDHPLVSMLKELDSFEITLLGAALLDSLLIRTSWR